MNTPTATAADPAAYVRFTNLTKKFGDFAAVDNVSLDIRRGEIFCLLGGSGSGKTTLLRMLAGFETPTAGTIEIDGADMSKIPPYERPVNMMFQSYALFPHMNVEKNVAFGLEQEGLSRAEVSRKVGEILEIVKMGGFGARKPHQLSGGQRQRVALARALVKRPKLLLLDEPLAALDKKLREYTQFELINIQQRLGVTFVVVTHDQEEAMTMASRIGVMDAGRLEQVATPRELYEAPLSRWIAEFVGDVNLFDGQLETRELRRLTIATRDAGHIVATEPRQGVTKTIVSVAVRPEKVKLSRRGPASDADHEHSLNRLEGVVCDVSYLGGLTIYKVKLDSGAIIRSAMANTTRIDVDAYSLSQRVVAWFTPDDCVVLEQ